MQMNFQDNPKFSSGIAALAAISGQPKMKRLLIYIFVIFALTSARTQNLIGFGTGFDWIEGFDADPIYSNKDINLNFSHSRKILMLEARQGFRYLEGFKTIRYNTYLLIGLTSPKEKFFVFDLLVGGALSFANQNNTQKYPHYINQFCPTIKTSFNFRISSKNKIYLGVDWLISSYRYLEGNRWGSPRSTGGITGSVLLSLNYVLNKKLDRGK